ncbi:MAG: HepT-like ribonuclease domain-containing protein [Roseiarcus sp.]
MGNVLRHEYQGLSDAIIWRVVVDELPRLKLAIESIARADGA